MCRLNAERMYVRVRVSLSLSLTIYCLYTRTSANELPACRKRAL